jgi:4-diphosphocytidyl-2-C-methyl-D-erythritol kinase
MMRKLKTNSPAKVNLFLYVKGRDHRGYHLLQSLFITIPSLNDKITIELNNSGIIRIESNTSIAVDDNIMTKAAKKLVDLTGNNQIGMDFKLHKRIPIGAGLGGGSSNAATTMIELNKILGLNLTIERLVELSEDIGDDVKFFLMQKNAVYFDGDKMHEIQLGRKFHLLLVKPDFSINTKDVYNAFRKDVKTTELKPVISQEDILHHIITGENQLYETVKKINPKIEYILDELSSQDGCITARMSGSGSTCFGLFSNLKSSKEAMNRLLEVNPEWFIHMFSCENQ